MRSRRSPEDATNSRPARPVWQILAILGAVLLLKLIVVLQLSTHPLVQPEVGLDTSAYAELAGRVLAGDVSLGPRLYYVSPLYIYFLAGFLATTDSFTAVRVIQVVLGTLSVSFLFLAAREWFGERAAWIGAGMMALTGLFTFYESLILQAALDPFLTSAALASLAFALKPHQPSDRAGRFLATGVLFGIGALNRPNLLLAALGIATMLLAIRRVRGAALLAAGIVIGLAPVTIRNVVVADQWSVVSSQGGLNFYIGNGEGATGFYRQLPGIRPTIDGQSHDSRRVAERAAGRPLTDLETSDYFYRLAWDWIRQHPMSAVALFARKVGYVFIAQHIALPYSYPFYAYDAGTALRFYAIGPWLLVPLGLAGLVWAAPAERRRDYLVWVSFVPAYAIGIAVFFVSERYRLPLLVPLCAGAGAAVDAAVRALSTKRRGALLLPAAVCAALIVAVNWPRPLRDGRWEEGLRLAQRLVILGRFDEADAWARRLQPNAPRPGLASYGIGMQYREVGQPARAVIHLSRALELDPNQAIVEYGLGQALLEANRPEEAVKHLRRGFEAGLDVPLAGYDLAVALERLSDYQAAAAVVRRIKPGRDDDQEVFLKLGRLASRVKAADLADTFFRRAVEMRPDQASARKQFGLNLLVLGRHEEALHELSEAVRLDPRDSDSLAHLAYAEYQLGRSADALTHATQALTINPEDRMARPLVAALRQTHK